MKGTEMLKSSGSKGTAEPLLVYKAKEDKEQTENVNVKCEDLKAPVELLMKFLGALKDKYFQLAVKLCHMILIYEPDNPEASEFLPLIQKKLLEEQHAEKSNEEESDDDDIDSGSDEDPSHSSSCSSSSASDDDDHVFTVDESCNVTQTKELILESIWSTLQSFVMAAIKLAQIKC
ncbi:glutamate-rich protein 2 isoform X2 [Pundamilia nyererei]|uniref:Glutamate-rich protein 2 isoform X2 n=1 Tax=Pundamilia nyererei TaxID=303518 RepID=A0A9Y3VS32_9CICH|nr:PREDICTED: glutamate-rich protein 2-like isoform X2 [Pundamilia nyererei]